MRRGFGGFFSYNDNREPPKTVKVITKAPSFLLSLQGTPTEARSSKEGPVSRSELGFGELRGLRYIQPGNFQAVVLGFFFPIEGLGFGFVVEGFGFTGLGFRASGLGG